MDISAENASLQAFCAVCCAFVATVIFLVQGHVVFHLLDPSTYVNIFHHKCGLLFAGCTLWAAMALLRCVRQRPAVRIAAR